MPGSLSIMGLYNWDEHIFDLLQVPAPFQKDEQIFDILKECGELELTFPDWGFMRTAIGHFSVKYEQAFLHIADAILAQYSPIENKDQYAEITDTETPHGYTRNSTDTFTPTNYKIKDTGSNTESRTGYESGTLKVTGKNEISNTQEILGTYTNSRNETYTGSRELKHVDHTHGNIGVTSNQELINQELDLMARYSFYGEVTKLFKKEFCLGVY